MHERVCLKVSDGTEMNAYLARPKGAGKFPGILVLQEIFGVNRNIRSIADRFAAEGFVALAPELFHRTAPGVEIAYTDLQKGFEHASKHTPDRVAADLKAAFDWLSHDPSVRAEAISCVGYCRGGFNTFLANSVLPLKAAISYYGARIPQILDRASAQSAPILFFWGGKDEHIPPAQREEVLSELRRLKKPFVNVEFSASDHGFFCEERPSYDPVAARESWALALAFLKR